MFDLPKYGDGLCLARMADLLGALEIDRARLQARSVVITGSNGKGSSAAFTAAIGRAFGLRTGMFTSPHLFRFNERFQIDGAPIDDATLTALVARVMAAIMALPAHRFGAFEAQFALACLYFQDSSCGFMVFEAGIGGRFDPVRLIGARATCVTSVDYEHTDLLGRSREAIVSDKSDACASSGTIVYGENCRPLKQHLVEYNRNRGVKNLFVYDDITISRARATANGQQFDLTIDADFFAALDIAMAGDFQINNAAVAVALFQLWALREQPQADRIAIDTAIRTGLREARWAGRVDAIAHDPLTVIDVGHTPDGVTQALKGLFARYGDGNWLLVLGVSQDKDIAAIVARLAPAFASIVCTSAHHKGADAQAIAAAVRAANPAATIHLAATIAEAVRISRDRARESNNRIYVAGGLFVAIEYAHVLGGGRAEELAFF